MVGPLLSGSFSEYLGYYWTCFVLGMFCAILLLAGHRKRVIEKLD